MSVQILRFCQVTRTQEWLNAVSQQTKALAGNELRRDLEINLKDSQEIIRFSDRCKAWWVDCSLSSRIINRCHRHFCWIQLRLQSICQSLFTAQGKKPFSTKQQYMSCNIPCMCNFFSIKEKNAYIQARKTKFNIPRLFKQIALTVFFSKVWYRLMDYRFLNIETFC